jgi:hypothetical protein
MKRSGNYFGMKRKQRTKDRPDFPVTLTGGGRVCHRDGHEGEQEMRTSFLGSARSVIVLKG